ncbi:pak-box p21-rho-binding protein [Colletotrichum truncatum]|uniref:Pak-box p21-rho-binding protein n=1 Tax=Colletotrichum truncatum TaxID=5467 RepID=A0ACC3YIC1_COLTU|nr:pak-box p21-rho-binding protein [Colletotrichum truncatum]KAF6794505.1 pak-box p21-rho-binding protein [Colletotrichum truncatum]
MWATAPLPYYSAYKPPRRKERASASNKDAALPSSVNNQVSLPPLSTQHNPNTIPSELFEPALDGPPSPERIRALSKQMKRASAVDKHKSNATTSSGSSSSLRSITSDRRPSWEHTLETITLSRKSSGRSTSSSMPSRDRPESVQLFGKTIFNRRAKMKRESSSNSSGSSLYSGEIALDGLPSANKDPLLPSIFGRRRTLRQDQLGDDPALARKLQISGPYNFQHVTHTRRDHLPDLQRGSRAELVTEFSAIRASQRPTTGSLRGIDVEDLHFSNFSSEALNMPPPENAFTNETHAELFLNRPPVLARQVVPTSAPRRSIMHTRSQEQLRSSPPRPAPPRPPRSPIDEEAIIAAIPTRPMPPPRTSSRISLQQGGLSTIEDIDPLERPQTSGSFHHPDSFHESMNGPQETILELPHAADLNLYADPRFSHAITTPDDAAWPLTASTNFSYEMALPDVPEEEEAYPMGRHSRASLVSTRSSLRGSQSVPALRHLAQAHEDEPQRPPSGASDTLGSFDMLTVQTALRAALEEDEDEEEVTGGFHRASWEDDIDYCYEHEVEANCDYAWERPSLDIVREEVAQPLVDNDAVFVAPLSIGLKPASTGHLDIPALSPSSPTSPANGHEAITPTISALPIRPNFSHPRMETSYRGQSHLHVRTASHASSFKESHGFNLSPSLLIPGDFRQQMLAESDADEYPTPMSRGHSSHFSFDAEPTMTMETPGLFARDRASTSTTGSNSSDQTTSTEARHTSTNSTWTALTRYTGSTTFEGWNPKAEGIDHSRSISVDDFPDLGSPKGRKSTMATLPETEEMLTTSHSTGNMRAVSEGTSANLSRESLPLTKTKEPIKHRRQRARTTSLSTPPPPGQYALFPPVYSGSRI